MSIPSGYVYFILNKNTDCVKIGFTKHKDVNKRVKQLQTGSSDLLELIYYVEGNFDVEKYFHRMFAKDRIRTNNEWFNYSYAIKNWIFNDRYIKENKEVK